MPLEVAQGIADAYPGQPYLIAGLQWQWYALSLPATPAVASVNTGVQSVAYAGSGSAFDAAMARADFFFGQAFGTLVSVPLIAHPNEGPWGPLRDMSWWIDP